MYNSKTGFRFTITKINCWVNSFYDYLGELILTASSMHIWLGLMGLTG